VVIVAVNDSGVEIEYEPNDEPDDETDDEMEDEMEVD
jgi:hypothetical protein